MGGPLMTPDERDALIAKELIMIGKELSEKFKIVVWWKSGGEIREEYAYGNTPEEVVNHMRRRCWIEEENKNSQKYMSGVQSRTIGAENFLFHDEESFLFGLVKIDSLHIQKWGWEPESDIE
jgi:hypothetical protein